jgi:hypothetical protein
LFPADSGFADVQWLPISTLDGTPVPADRRSEARPLPDGRSVLLTERAAALIGIDGFGTRWELPGELTVLSADPFLDGLLITAVNNPTNESGRVLVAALRPGLAPTGFWMYRFFGPITPGPTTIAVADQAVFGLGSDESAFLSVKSIQTLYPLAPFSLDGVAWIGGDHQEIRSNSGTVLARGTYSLPGRATAWDGDAGLVTSGEDGLRWLVEDDERAVEVPNETIGELVEVVAVSSGHVLGARLYYPFTTISWFELETGRISDPPAGARTVDGVTFSAAGRSAMIELPDWSSVQRGEGGEPLPPFELPELVISSDDGIELLRIPVGSSQRPYVQIHDFDGRRLIISAVPNEPALPPQTLWIVDLECGNCTEMFETGGPVWFDLIGTLESGGPVVQPALPTVPTRGWPAP